MERTGKVGYSVKWGSTLKETMPETPSFAAGFSSSFILVFVLSISLLLLRERSGDASGGPARGLRTLVVLGSGMLLLLLLLSLSS